MIKTTKTPMTTAEIAMRLGIKTRTFQNKIPELVKFGIRPLKLKAGDHRFWFYWEDVLRFMEQPK